MQVSAFQDLALYPNYCLYLRSSSAELTAYRSYVIFRTCSARSWSTKAPYKVSIGSMQLQLQELQETNFKAQELKQQEFLDGPYRDIDGMLHYQGLPFMLEAIWMERISRHHDDPLAGHVGIEKTCELPARKYYWPTLRHNVEAYVKGCDACLASKAVRHKPYRDLQSLLVPTH